ncbi:MAG: NUDIX hydrolase [Gammaproteobacteria bacterium]|jgi:ADP-ribose pyrophosphatase YjhB (NUDIX family)|nr:NUDIX hydrolase [Gammaproteobacteria bacterium]
MKYCSNCGTPVEVRIPEGEHLPRHVCPSCSTVHYHNPKLVVGCVPEDEHGRILICKRAIAPRIGYWTIPAGFMENGETLQEAAAREAQEEALADVEIGSLLAVVHVLHAQQVHVFFRGRLRSSHIGAGPESLEVKMIEAHEIPWTDIAFASTDFTLRRYLEDRAAGMQGHHFTEFGRNATAIAAK